MWTLQRHCERCIRQQSPEFDRQQKNNLQLNLHDMYIHPCTFYTYPYNVLCALIYWYLHEIRPERMYDCTERQSVAPRRRHVGDLDRLVTLGDLFAPVEQVLRGCEVSTAATT